RQQSGHRPRGTVPHPSRDQRNGTDRRSAGSECTSVGHQRRSELPAVAHSRLHRQPADQPGTAQAYGSWVILFNKSTKRSAFLDAYAFSKDAIDAAWPDIKSMIESMV